MNKKTLAAAVTEAKRFLECAKAYSANPPAYEFSASKEGGAVKRASMDLTRALADLRRPS